MYRKLALAAALALGMTSTASAQVRIGVGIGPVVLPSARPVLIAPVHHYHVQVREPWQERGFHCPIEARAFERYQERLGYQAYTVGHGYHYDVRYRIPGWRTYRTVHSDYLAHQLEHQLEHQGYEARVVHH